MSKYQVASYTNQRRQSDANPGHFGTADMPVILSKRTVRDQKNDDRGQKNYEFFQGPVSWGQRGYAAIEQPT